MANRNGMGPQEQGPRTGRGLGNCPQGNGQGRMNRLGRRR